MKPRYSQTSASEQIKVNSNPDILYPRSWGLMTENTVEEMLDFPWNGTVFSRLDPHRLIFPSNDVKRSQTLQTRVEKWRSF